MSPSLSAMPEDHQQPPTQCRRVAAAIKPQLDIDTRPSQKDDQPLSSAQQPHYTVIIRLPFRRGDFQDPPPMSWDATKDKELWKVISSGTTKDLDWASLTQKFDVPLAFLLQQAAWLYERHFESVKKGMSRLGDGGNASPLTAGQGAGGDAAATPTMQGSDRASPVLVEDEGKMVGTRMAKQPGISRTPSSATVTQIKTLALTPRSSRPYHKTSLGKKNFGTSRPRLEEDLDRSGDEVSDSEVVVALDGPLSTYRSASSKQPDLSTLKSSNDAEASDNDDEDSNGEYLPFATRKLAPDEIDEEETEDQTATLISPPPTRNPANDPRNPPPLQDSSASSTTSSAPRPQNSTSRSSPNPLSPQRMAPRAMLSPRYKGVVSGSEGSPSMGSSFSDLDDLSVTQSAMEDAFLSHVRGGGSIGMGMGSLVGRGRGGG